MVIWIIGLSGSGKTTLATKVMEHLDGKLSNVVLLDGDMVREAFGNDLGHNQQDRLINAQRICGLCKLLDDQGFHVVCAILSLFQETRDWNRENLTAYHEVFIDVEIGELISRDPKKLYARFKAGEISGIPGLDIPFTPPLNHDQVIVNNSSQEGFLKNAEDLAALLQKAG